MFIDITGNDLFNQHVGMTCAEVRLRCSWISQAGNDLDLFDQCVGMVCAAVRLRCSLISLVMICLINLWVWYVLKLDLDVHGYDWY